ncbi:MAG: anthranilate phosphoribosyltransferase, partial [Candidatus Peregrinibacteria bacterium]|nr:anthranilate phosphoribosyltransferase [Candidatus Peregrinibacteria bacterium]
MNTTLATTDRSLTESEAYDFLNQIVEGSLSEETIKSILINMAKRGETIEEITGMARAMREHVIPINVKGPLLDTCGTGGSGLPRINTSTLVSFILAADGIHIAKHGNKAASGRCGSFDVLEELGVNIMLNAKQIEAAINQTNLGFIYAKQFHPVMKNIMPIRKAIGQRTIFNLLGPLLNPARAQRHILGTNDLKTAEKMIQVLKNLGLERALVMKGIDGLDEITLTSPTVLFELRNGKITQSVIHPDQFGLEEVA